MAFAAVCRQAQLHADRVVARKAALVRPLQFKAQTIGLWQGLGATQQNGACAVRQHPAQEMRVKVCVIALRGKARALEETRGHFTGHGQGQIMRAAFHRHGGGLHGAHAGSADTVHRKRFHRRRGHLTLNHAGKAGHQGVTTR